MAVAALGDAGMLTNCRKGLLNLSRGNRSFFSAAATVRATTQEGIQEPLPFHKHPEKESAVSGPRSCKMFRP